MYEWKTSADEKNQCLVLGGVWLRTEKRPYAADCLSNRPDSSSPVVFDCTALEAWDSTFVVFVQQLITGLEKQQLSVARDALPSGVLQLITLATSTDAIARKPASSSSWLQNVGLDTLALFRSINQSLAFLGEVFLGLLRLLVGRSDIRWRDMFLVFVEVGPSALPIVSLISVLVGVILAFVGAVQLRMFSAEIYIADLVGLGMAREMGAMMTGIIMAGRTGAAFAAQLGTMQVNEEIDAIKTMGMNAIDYLVIPRLLALILAVPLLTLYADVMGILGGMMIGSWMMDIPPYAYYLQTIGSLSLGDFAVGLFKGSVFGVLIALAGCMRGIYSGRSASAVGIAATSAVVTAIVSIVVADAILTVLYDALGI